MEEVVRAPPTAAVVQLLDDISDTVRLSIGARYSILVTVLAGVCCDSSVCYEFQGCLPSAATMAP